MMNFVAAITVDSKVRLERFLQKTLNSSHITIEILEGE